MREWRGRVGTMKIVHGRTSTARRHFELWLHNVSASISVIVDCRLSPCPRHQGQCWFDHLLLLSFQWRQGRDTGLAWAKRCRRVEHWQIKEWLTGPKVFLLWHFVGGRCTIWHHRANRTRIRPRASQRRISRHEERRRQVRLPTRPGLHNKKEEQSLGFPYSHTVVLA